MVKKFIIALFTCLPIFMLAANKPNVLLIVADDLGYGDLGVHGNKHVRTPALDRLSKKGTRYTHFYVSPVCAPTRSSLMTGRYSIRTGVVDTYSGGAIMHSSEITLAELLKTAGYQTGIFGKWHLGDTYPYRAMDQGFDKSVVHLSGGVGQVGDYLNYHKKDSSYFNPFLLNDGEVKEYKGYCSDVFANEAVNFIEAHHDKPFFCYLSFNAPHAPLQLPGDYYDLYKRGNPTKGYWNFQAIKDKHSEEVQDIRKVYGMISNIDDNVSMVLSALKRMKIMEQTLIIFMSDNGPKQARYNYDYRGLKSTVYEGGIRSPLIIYYGNMQTQREHVNDRVAHIDILPTVAEVCALDLPENLKLDGISFAKTFMDTLNVDTDYEDRSLFFYWNRKKAVQYNNMAIINGPHKLIAYLEQGKPIFELYDISTDSIEGQNIAAEEYVQSSILKKEMDRIYNDLVDEPNFSHKPFLKVGSKSQNPVVLGRNDARSRRVVWEQEEIEMHWDIEIEKGKYELETKFFDNYESGGSLILELNGELIKYENIEFGENKSHTVNFKTDAYKGKISLYYQVGETFYAPHWLVLNKI